MQPVRHHHTIERPDGAASTLLLMPAWTDFNAAGASAGGHIGVKVVTVSPDNNAIGKPAVMGLYLLLDGATGEPQALIDGQRLTQWRTACASALAATYLAREDASRLLVIGAGALAPFLARAHAAVRPISEIRHLEPDARQCREGGRRAGRRRLRRRGRRPISTPSSAEADIVSSATISTTPLVKGALLKPGTHVDLVGGFTPDMRESDDDAIRRARVYVDTRAGATKEAGDIVQPLASGVLKPRRHRRRPARTVRAARSRAARAPTRSRCSSRSARRSRISPPASRSTARLRQRTPALGLRGRAAAGFVARPVGLCQKRPASPGDAS